MQSNGLTNWVITKAVSQDESKKGGQLNNVLKLHVEAIKLNTTSKGLDNYPLIFILTFG